MANRKGTSPSKATVAVIMTGLKRWTQPSRTAAATDMPSSRRRRMQLTSTTPLSTAMPHSAMNPTEAGTLTYSPVRNRPMTPPIEAKGSTRMISEARRKELNSMNSRKKIAAIVRGTITMSVSMARCMFSN